FNIDPCFILHTANAYEQGSHVVLEGMRYDRVMDETLQAEGRPRSHLWRWTIDLTTGTVRDEQLHDLYEEVPRIDDRRATLPTRHPYTACLEEPPGNDPYAIVRHDTSTGKAEVREYPKGVVPSEPVFVARDDAAAEDDGWVMTYVTDMSTA